jgi:hypothetical protein
LILAKLDKAARKEVQIGKRVHLKLNKYQTPINTLIKSKNPTNH